MIPQIATIRVQNRPDQRIRLWIPLLPIYLILTPLLPLIIIAAVIACARYQINPIRALTATTRLLASLSGLHVDVKHGPTTVLVKLS